MAKKSKSKSKSSGSRGLKKNLSGTTVEGEYTDSEWVEWSEGVKDLDELRFDENYGPYFDTLVPQYLPPKLERLQLDFPNPAISNMHSVGHLLVQPNCQLNYLNLSGCNIGREHVRALCDPRSMSVNSSLQSIVLFDNPSITAEDILWIFECSHAVDWIAVNHMGLKTVIKDIATPMNMNDSKYHVDSAWVLHKQEDFEDGEWKEGVIAIKREVYVHSASDDSDSDSDDTDESESESESDSEEEEARRLAAAAAAEKAKREAEEKARLEKEKKEAKRKKKEAAEKAKREAEEKAKREAEEKARLDKEAEAYRRIQEERAQIAAEREKKEKAEADRLRKAKREAEEKAKREAEEKAKREAKEKARLEKERKEAEEKAKREAKEKARLEKERKEAEEKAKREAKEKARLEKERKKAEEKAKREAEEKAKREAKEKARLEKERKEAEDMARWAAAAEKAKKKKKKKKEEDKGAGGLTDADWEAWREDKEYEVQMCFTEEFRPYFDTVVARFMPRKVMRLQIGMKDLAESNMEAVGEHLMSDSCKVEFLNLNGCGLGSAELQAMCRPGLMLNKTVKTVILFDNPRLTTDDFLTILECSHTVDWLAINPISLDTEEVLAALKENPIKYHCSKSWSIAGQEHFSGINWREGMVAIRRDLESGMDLFDDTSTKKKPVTKTSPKKSFLDDSDSDSSDSDDSDSD